MIGGLRLSIAGIRIIALHHIIASVLIGLLMCDIVVADEATDQWVTDYKVVAASASQSGKYLLAICKNVDDEDEVKTRHMVLFDLDRRRQLKAVEYERPKLFGIDDNQIFLLPQGSKELKILDLRSFEEQSSVELKEEVLDMTLVDQSRIGLLVKKKEGFSSLVYLNRKSLKREQYLEFNETFASPRGGSPYSDSFYRARTELKNRATGKFVCVVETPMLNPFSTRKNPAPMVFPDSSVTGSMNIYPTMPVRGVVRGGQEFGTAVESKTSPGRWSWRWMRMRGNEFILTRKMADTTETWVVPREAENNLNTYVQFFVPRRDDVVFISNQVFTFIPKKPVNSTFFRFQRKPVPIFDTAKSVEIPLSCIGGSGKKIWTGLTKSPHLWVDEDSGILTANLPAMWTEHLSVAAEPDSNYREFPPQQAAAEYKRITGNPVPEGKQPFCIPFKFRVEDAKLQRVEMSIFLVVLAPIADYKVAKSVTPVTKGIADAVGSALSSMGRSENSRDNAVEKGPPTLDERISGAQKKATEIQNQLGRIESLVKEIRSLERGDK